MEVNGDQQLFGYQHSSKYLLLLFNIWNVPNIWFGMTWGRVNYDKIKMLGWTIPFKGKQTCHQQHTGPFKQWIKRHLEKDLSVLSAPQVVSTWFWYHSLPSYGQRVSTEWWIGSVYYPWVNKKAACYWLCGFHCSQIYGSGAWLWIQSSTLTHSLHWERRI